MLGLEACSETTSKMLNVLLGETCAHCHSAFTCILSQYLRHLNIFSEPIGQFCLLAGCYAKRIEKPHKY